MLVLVATNDLGSALLYFGIFIAMLYIATARLSFVARRARALRRRRLRRRPRRSRTSPSGSRTGSIRGRRHKVYCPLNGTLALRQDCQSYQLVKSLYSIANGGFGGTGLGKGTFTTTSGTPLIPDVNTDFIYSALAQELGLIGVSALLLVFMVFVARGMKVALRVDDGFSKLLAAGLTFGFALQTFTIVGGILRIIPLTGITLPFVSYGGSSIVANFLLLAGLLLVSNRANSSDVRAVNKPHLPGRARRARAARRADRRDDLLADLGRGGPRRAEQDNEIQRVAQFTIDRGKIYRREREDGARRRTSSEDRRTARRSTSAPTRPTASPRRSSATRRRAARAPGSSAPRTAT